MRALNARLRQWGMDILLGILAAIIVLLILWASVQPKSFVYQGY
jgi:hypothetical protein